jgi:hypothetical protein
VVVEAYSERRAVAEEAGGNEEGEAKASRDKQTGGAEAANRDHEKNTVELFS